MRLLPTEPAERATASIEPSTPAAASSTAANQPEPKAGPLGADEYQPVPWSTLPDHRCFGCSQTNASGLRLRFATRDDGAIETLFRLDRTFESYPGIVHGGLIGVICDETMGNLIVLRTGLTSLTIGMRLRYVNAVRVNAEYRCTARLTDRSRVAVDAGAGGLLRTESEVVDADGTIVATATATYRPISMDGARAHLTLTADAFDRAEASLTAAVTSPNSTQSQEHLHP